MDRKFKKNLRSIGDISQKITAPLFDKKGFLSGSLIKDWALIVGKTYAHQITPQKITFPKSQTTGGTLHLFAENSGVALLFEHAKTEVMRRINEYYGYGAIARISLKHRPSKSFTPQKPQKKLLMHEKQGVAKQVENLEDRNLRDLLENLGISIALHNKK